ncbi:competence protein CoiA [Bacillus tuaregi]|uniref:competence protein CoiA n=1 Tax=Bacillus tuaregi TaxID=1816695 RepID=UPI0008F8FE1A|nr:competence protein CoiA family protein [Bacillus tuaregi]
MLTAIRIDGTAFHLLPRRPREALKKEKEKGGFFCPECKEKVIMKVGTKKMEHFAHQKGSLCVESYERESEYHMNGKLQLFEWLGMQDLHPKIEPYFPLIRQRPDIGITYMGKDYAFEFQCAVIPPELMVKRTRQYLSHNIEPIWILGGKNINRKGTRKVTLTSFDYLFLRKSSSGQWFLPAFCPTSNQFILMTNISPVTPTNALCEITTFTLQSILIRDVLMPIKGLNTCTSHEWRKEIRKQKSSILLQGFRSDFLKELYLHSMNISLLPVILGLPVPNAPIIETPPLIWQSYLFMDCFYRAKKEIISFGNIYRSFMDRVSKQHIKLRFLPLAPDSSPVKPLSEYLHLLARLDILEAVNSTTFKVKKEIMIPEHCLKQQEQEEVFYQKSAHLVFNLIQQKSSTSTIG